MTGEVEQLYAMLKRIHEPKGYLFNKDRRLVLELLQGLLLNKARYGYMSCPCRLAAGERESDRDIFCPCVYRAPDVEEYGACFCKLYVSADYNAGRTPDTYVPERRPPEKMAW